MRAKTVVITGGTSGIGEVAAVALAKMGARIVLVARDKSRGDATLLGFATAPQTSLTPYILPICYAWPR